MGSEERRDAHTKPNSEPNHTVFPSQHSRYTAYNVEFKNNNRTPPEKLSSLRTGSPLPGGKRCVFLAHTHAACVELD